MLFLLLQYYIKFLFFIIVFLNINEFMKNRGKTLNKKKFCILVMA